MKGVCSECGSEDLWAWYSQPERQTIDVEIDDEKKVSYEYTGTTESSYDVGEDDEYFCSGCGRITETIEEMVGVDFRILKPDKKSEDEHYLEAFAGLALNVATILIDRETTAKSREEIFAIIRNNVDAIYEIFGRDIDLVEEWIKKGEWT